MRVLLVGAFGNLGTSCIRELSQNEDEIRCFCRKSRRSMIWYNIYRKKFNFEVYWGNILDRDLISKVLTDIDVVIQLLLFHLFLILNQSSQCNLMLKGQKF